MHATQTMSTCPKPEALEQVAAGAPTDEALRRHLDACASCRATLAAIAADNELIAELVAAERERASTVRMGHAADDGLDRPDAASDAASGGPQVPGYDLLREIHRGGQGVVHEAMQHSTRRRVAIKLLLRGRLATERQLRRFEREIETVAALRHPGIVTLYESGRARTGETYFAMELVEGSTLDRAWAARRTAGGGGLREALALFAAICRAVTHAHQKGVIHCDLKPSNILVDADGAPRLLDFGIARMRGGADHLDVPAQSFAGTFAYAAPEQLRGAHDSFDVRVDVYALGVILHELLLGASPWAECASVGELIDAKCGTDRPVMASRGTTVDAEAMAIVGKALAREASDRYQSVAELLDDVERRLADRPISIRKDSLPYILGKAARRHRGLVLAMGAGALASLTLAALLAVMIVRHERERRNAIDTLGAFREALAATDPLDARGGGTSLSAFLGSVGAHVDDRLADQPSSAAAIHASLGQIAINAAEYDLANHHLGEALRLTEAAGDQILQAECLHQLGRVAFHRGDYHAAAVDYREALLRRTSLLGPDHADVASTSSHLASCLRRLGDLDEAERLLRAALATRLRHPERPEEIAAAWNNLGSLVQERGRLDEAQTMFARALEIIRSATPPGDWRVAHALRNHAICLVEQGRCEEARPLLDESAAIWTSLVDDDHPALASVRHAQGRADLGAGRLREAAESAGAALEARRRRLGPTHPDVAESLDLLGRIAIADGRTDDAIAFLEESLLLRRGLPRGDERALATTAALLGELLGARGDHQAAGELLGESADIWRRHAERDPPASAGHPSSIAD